MLLYKSEREFQDNFLMPFLFFPTKWDPIKNNNERLGYAIVLIALWDCTFADMDWAVDENIGSAPLVPSVDVYSEAHRFETELEALQFMKEWWSKAKI